MITEEHYIKKNPEISRVRITFLLNVVHELEQFEVDLVVSVKFSSQSRINYPVKKDTLSRNEEKNDKQ